MATETTVQVIPSSADVAGMSVVTASRHQAAPRSGLIYNPATLAAGVPVWFHPMPDGRYLTLFARRLTDAALSPASINGVLLYTGYEVSDAPCWATIGPRTGDTQPVRLIPSEQPGIRRLIAAASRGSYLFTLNWYKKSLDDDETYALLQNFRVSDRGITLLGEETVPRNLGLGIYCDRRYLWLLGQDENGKLSLARKNWGRIGTDDDANPVMNWQFWGKGNWNTDPDQMAAVIDNRGKQIALDGPCSLARYRDTYYLMATTKSVTTPTGPSSTDRLFPLLHPDGTRLYVSDYKTSIISVINLDTNEITSTIDIKSRPWSMVFNPSGTKLYVANHLANIISVIDPATDEVTAEITVSKDPGAMVFHPNGTRIYMINNSVNTLTIIDAESNNVLEAISVGKQPDRLTINSDGSRLYVTNKEDKTVSIINTVTNRVIKNASVGYRNTPTVVTTKGNKVYIGGTDSILGLDTTRNRITSSFPVLNIGMSLLAHPTQNRLYLANILDTISVINLDTSTVTDTIATGTDMGAVQIALSANGSRLYATNTYDKTVSVINTTTNAVIDLVSLNEGVKTVEDEMNPILAQLVALLNGVINGFIKIGTGVTTMITNLFDQAVSLITGQPGSATESVKTLVGQLLGSLTGTGTTLTNPASILENIIRAITGIPGVQQVVDIAEDFLTGVINTILGLATTVLGPGPVKLLEDIIRAITGILTGTGNDGGAPADVITVGTSQVSLTPEPSWQAVAYASRKVQQDWSLHGYTYPIAKTTTVYQDSGVYLQEQIPLTPGYGVTTANSTASYLDTTSDHIQVYTGTSPHIVILPPTAKVLGTTVSTEGVVDVPVDPLNFNPTISIEDATVTEGNFRPSTVRFRVSLSSASSSTITVKYATSNDTATAGSDFTAASGTLTFAPGIVSQQIIAEVAGDFSFEPDETFTVTLSEPANANLGDDDTAVCTIVNDDRQTIIESLLEDFKNIVNGVISGAIQLGSALVTAVTTILEQSVRTLTGVVGDTGELVLSLVDTFLNFISGGSLDLGEFDSPTDLLASILSRITGGGGEIASTISTLAAEFYEITVSTITVIQTGIVSVFQNLINSIFGSSFSTFSAMSSPMLMSSSVMSAEDTEPVVYMPYTIHNQSTADIVVMAADRDKTVTVPKGTGMTFTPYVSEPLLIKDWSWNPAADRAPRARQGFPLLSTNRLNVNTYLIDITGTPTSGVFRLAHDGNVSQLVTIGTTAAATADSIRLAIASLKSVNTFSVTDQSATRFTVVIIEDSSTLDVYSYRMFNGTSPKVEVTLDNSDSTLLTRWSTFQPDPQPAAPSGAVPAITTITTEIPSELPDIIAQFVKVISVVSGGLLTVGTGVIGTVTDLLGQAVYLITGQKITTPGGVVEDQVTDFLKKLAADDGVTPDAGTSFENILRQITGGTGITTPATVPDPLDFVTAAVNAVEDTIETLAELLQDILRAITGN